MKVFLQSIGAILMVCASIDAKEKVTSQEQISIKIKNIPIEYPPRNLVAAKRVRVGKSVAPVEQSLAPLGMPYPSPVQPPTPSPEKCCACESLFSSVVNQTCAIDCGKEDSGNLIGLEGTNLYDRRVLHDVVFTDHRKLGLCIRTPFAGGRVRFVGCNTANIALIPENSDGVFGGPPPNGWTHTVNPGTGPTYFSVDGFCIRGLPLSWVKIGDHCDVTFTCTPGGGITYERCCNWCASLLVGVPSVQTQAAGAWPHCDAISGWPNAAGGINP